MTNLEKNYDINFKNKEDLEQKIYDVKKILRIRNLRFTRPNLQKVMSIDAQNIISAQNNYEIEQYYKAFTLNAYALNTFSITKIADKINNEIKIDNKRTHKGMIGVQVDWVVNDKEVMNKINDYVNELEKIIKDKAQEQQLKIGDNLPLTQNEKNNTNNIEKTTQLIVDNNESLLRKQKIAYDALFKDIVKTMNKNLPNVQFAVNIETVYGPAGWPYVTFIFPNDKNFRLWNNFYNDGDEELCDYIDTTSVDLATYTKNKSKNYKLNKEKQIDVDKK